MDRVVYQRMDALQDDHWWFRARRDILSKVLRQSVPSEPRPRILEVGCGTGGNLKMLSSVGHVTAFEHDQDALKMAREKGDFYLEQGTLPHGAPAYDEPFDMVVAFDVLEHIEADLESLKALRTYMKPDGKLVITVPAFPFLWSRHDETHHHFRRYTRKHLKQVLTDAGYEMEYASYFNSLLFPLIAAVRIVRKTLRITESADDKMPRKSVNTALQAIFSSERHWIGRLSVPFGVSLIATARNPG